MKACVSSLLRNSEAAESDLIVFVDGPRANKVGEAEKVTAVRDFVKSITGFKSVDSHFAVENKGLANSIISGVTSVLEEYGRAIVLEDDLYLAPSFLSFMNTMLDKFEYDDRIMQVTGYSTLIRRASRYSQDVYLSRRAHSWSWATWKDRWRTVDWEVKDYEELMESKSKKWKFNEYGSDMVSMLRGWKEGRNHSWFVRFNYSMSKQKRYAVAPMHSLVRNDGFGQDATNCNAYNRYKTDFYESADKAWRIPDDLKWSEKLGKESVRYWSVPYRIWGKIMSKLRG